MSYLELPPVKVVAFYLSNSIHFRQTLVLCSWNLIILCCSNSLARSLDCTVNYNRSSSSDAKSDYLNLIYKRWLERLVPLQMLRNLCSTVVHDPLFM